MNSLNRYRHVNTTGIRSPQIFDISETTIQLNDNLQISLQSIKSKRQPKDHKLKYHIKRIDPNTSLNHSTILEGHFSGTPTLFKSIERNQDLSFTNPTNSLNTNTYSVNLPSIFHNSIL